MFQQAIAASEDRRPMTLACMVVAVACSTFASILMFQIMAARDIIGVDYYTFVRNVSQPLSLSYRPHAIAPFAYPPTMPLLFLPFAQIGYVAFATLSMGAFLLACRKFLSLPVLGLITLSWPAMNVISCGQITALVLTFVLIGLTVPHRVVAGIAFAIAAGLKPQLVAFVPLYMIAIRDWRAFSAGLISYIAIVIVSIFVFGAEAWSGWLSSLYNYADVIKNGEVIQFVVTPIGIAERLNMSILPVALLCGALAIALPFIPYRNPLEALFGLSLASMCALPYGLRYDMLGVIPLAAAWISRGKWWPIFPYCYIYPIGALFSLLWMATRLTRVFRPASERGGGPK